MIVNPIEPIESYLLTHGVDLKPPSLLKLLVTTLSDVFVADFLTSYKMWQLIGV